MRAQRAGRFGKVDDIATYLAMGGYAAYVWPALGIAAGVLTVMAVAGVRRLRRSEAELRMAEGPGGRRRRRTDPPENGQ